MRGSLLVPFALGFGTVLAPPASSQFTERAAAVGLLHDSVTGLDQIGSLMAMRDWVQQGVAMGELTGDGLVDVIACSRFGGTKMWRNDVTTFTDVTAASGLDTADLDNCVTLGDYDADGDLDVFLGVHYALEGPLASANRLYRNDGTGVFEEQIDALGIRGNGHTIFAKFMDLDHDGDLDLYTAEFNGTPNLLFVNNGDGTFTERGAELGADIGGSTHVVGFADSDNDGYTDIFVGNDFVVSSVAAMVNNVDDVHLKNNGDGTFSNVTAGAGYDLQAGPHVGSGTMGMTFGDVNYDGYLDVFRTEIRDQVLTLNFGWPAGAPWMQAQDLYGVASPTVPDANDPAQFGATVGWGAKFFHADHDPWIDLFHVAGRVASQQPEGQRNFLYGGSSPLDGERFLDVTAFAGLYDEYDDRGLSVGDLDSDGDMDLLVYPAAGRIRYFENRAAQVSPLGWLKVYADTQTSAPGGYGTVVRYTDSFGYPHTVPISVDGQTAGMNEAVAHFGLGSATSVDLEVEFPSGIIRSLPGTAANQALVVSEPQLVRVTPAKLAAASAGGATEPRVGAAGSTGKIDPASAETGSGLGFTPQTPPVQARGTSQVQGAIVVTAFAHAQDGTPLGKDAVVAIDVPGLVPVGGVEHVAGNVFQRSFQRPTAAGDYRAAVSFDGFAPRIRPTITVTGELSPSETAVRVSPSAIRAGSGEPFEITVVPRDGRGVPLGAGLDVKLTLATAGVNDLPLADLGDGRYRVQASPAVAEGDHGISLTVDGASFNTATSLQAGGVVSAAATLLYKGDPTFDVAQLPHQLKLRIQPRDANLIRVGSGQPSSIQLIPDPGSEPAYQRVDLSSALDDGSYCIVLERDKLSMHGTAKGTFELYIDGVLAATTSYDF